MSYRSVTIASVALVVALAARITARSQSEPEGFPDIVDHFKYGSVGTEERAGLPYWIWRVLPIVFADKLPNRPGTGYERLGSCQRRRGARPPDRHVVPVGPRRAGRAQLRDLPCRHDPQQRQASRAASSSGCPPTRWICRATRAS